MSWLIIAGHPTVMACYVSMFVLAIRGDRAPSLGITNIFRGWRRRGSPGDVHGICVFAAAGIGSLLGGWFGGRVKHHFGEVMHKPERAWWVITGVGVGTAVLLMGYDLVVRPREGRGSKNWVLRVKQRDVSSPEGPEP